MGGISNRYFPRMTGPAHKPDRTKEAQKEPKRPPESSALPAIFITKATSPATLPVIPTPKAPKVRNLPPFEWTLVTTRSDHSPLEAYKAVDLIKGWLHRRKAAGEAHFRKNIHVKCAQVTFDTPECSGKAFPGIRISGTSEYAHDITIALLEDLARAVVLGLENSSVAQLDSSTISRVVRRVQQPQQLMAAE